MFTATQIGRAVQALCLSAWVCCLPLLTAWCVCCEDSCPSDSCCRSSVNEQCDSEECHRHSCVAHRDHELPHHQLPCSCTCCPCHILGIVAPAISSPQLTETESAECFDIAPIDSEVIELAREGQRSLNRSRCAPPLDRCSQLCRFMI